MSSKPLTTNLVSNKARLAAVNSASPPEYSWFKDFICSLPGSPGEVGWISMSLRIAPEQISLTFSPPLLTAVCQKSTASVCHHCLPRPSLAVLESALQRTLREGLRVPQEISQSLTCNTTHFSLRSQRCGSIMCVIIWNVWALFTVQRRSWEIFSFILKCVCHFCIQQVLSGDPEWQSYIL